jgi:ABC-type multidrug transport system fused ATPase/permease subunit
MALHWVRSILDWLADHMRPGGEDSAPLSQIGLTLRLFLILLLAGLSAVVGVLLFRLWKQHQRHALDIAALAIQAQPDLANEETCAEQLPEEGWLALARELAEKGKLRLALRAAFLATLAHLAQMKWIRIARFKSNREYRNELRRHALAKPETVERFSQSVAVFERVWYGAHETTRDLLERVLANQEELRRCE